MQPIVNITKQIPNVSERFQIQTFEGPPGTHQHFDQHFNQYQIQNMAFL